MGKPCSEISPDRLAVDTSALRAMKSALPGNCPQKALSRLISSRTATAPISASEACTSATAASSCGKAVSADMDAKMMFTIGRRAARQFILGPEQALAQRGGFIRSRAQAAQREANAFIGNLPIDKGEAFGQRQLVRQAQQIVEHAGAGARRIILDRHNRAKARSFGIGRAFQMQRIETKADPLVGQIMPRIAAVGSSTGCISALNSADRIFERFGAKMPFGPS